MQFSNVPLKDPFVPPPTLDGEEIILIDDQYFSALLADIEAAQSSINLEVYIFAHDFAGERIANALIAAALRGVKVRVLVDGIGSPWWGIALTKAMEKAGIETRIFHPFPLIISHWARAAHVPNALLRKIWYLLANLNRRNHRKMCIIDDRIVYVSSANIIKWHFKKEEGGDSWRDTSVRLLNVDTTYLHYAFEKVWNYVPLNRRIRFMLMKKRRHRIFSLNYSWYQRKNFYKNLLRRIDNARQRIWITNAYFIPDVVLLKALCDAAKRGIDIRILLPYRSDVLITSLVSKTFYSELLSNGVSIYEFLPRILHAKTLIIDDYFSVGSTNLNARSFRYNLEVDVNIQTLGSKKILENQFLIDLSESHQVNLDYVKKQPWLSKIFGWLLLGVRGWI